MAIQTFDRLNNLKTEKQSVPHSMPYEDYFGEMELTDYQKEERIGLAKEFEKVFRYIFSIIGTPASMGGDLDIIALYDATERRLQDVIYEYRNSLDSDEYIAKYCRTTARDLVDVTLKHIDDPYYKSADRARFVAENEANTVANYQDMREATQSGKTKKTWVSKADALVRHTHADVDRETIPIDEYFVVGDSMMLFPKDLSADPSPQEVVNCRCTIKYS